MDLAEATTLERIELIAKFVCLGHSSEREKQIALLLIADLAGDVRADRAAQIKKPPVGGLISGCGTGSQEV